VAARIQCDRVLIHEVQLPLELGGFVIAVGLFRSAEQDCSRDKPFDLRSEGNWFESRQ
jgi:hypothetical protein